MKGLSKLPALLLGLAVLGCGDHSPAEPAAARQFAFEADKLSELARYRSGPLQITIGLALKSIGPQGGSIALGGFEAIVPPGAVDKMTVFSIRLPVDPRDSEFVRAQFGPGLVLIHPIGVVINSSVRGGRNVWIESGVVIGENRGQVPELGDDLFVGSGAKIIGGVRIGQGARIGANAVVLHDVPDGATAVGIPARARPPAAGPAP